MDKSITIRNGVQELGIFAKDRDAWVSSRTLAEMFEKEHKNVLRDIADILKINDEFNQLNFELVKYVDKKGEKRPEYLMNRKGFTLVAMGFTGEKALAFKKAYINAFEEMVYTINSRILSKEGTKEMADAIKLMLPNEQWAYKNEADMVNKIVLGITAKAFRETNGIEEGIPIRDTVVADKLLELESALKLNAKLILGGLDRDTRKKILKANYSSD